MNLDIIRAVESCYAGVPREEAWLGGILDALASLDAGGLGLIAERFQIAPDGRRVADATVAKPSVPAGFFGQRDRAFPPEMLTAREPVVFAMKRATRIGKAREAERFFESFGAEDGIGVFAEDPDGRTVLISAAVVAGHPLSPRTVHQLKLFSAHLGAGARLRHASALRSDAGATEAVLDPAGKILDAVGRGTTPDAQRTLADAVRRMDRARGALRRADPDEALQLWQGLVDGTWSLVDKCEADGKRYILARRNEPGVRDPKALTPRERFVLASAAMGHQNKFIGYQLGFSPSAVARHLRSAQRKLGVSSRSELVCLFAPLVRER